MCFISVLGNNTSPSSLEHAVWVMLNYENMGEIVADSMIPAKSMANLWKSYEAGVRGSTVQCVCFECKRTLKACSCVTSVACAGF